MTLYITVSITRRTHCCVASVMSIHARELTDCNESGRTQVQARKFLSQTSFNVDEVLGLGYEMLYRL